VTRPGEHVSDRWAAWRAQVDLAEYEARWERMEAQGEAVHGEADLVCRYRPARVLDAGCGMGRVAAELARRGIEAAGADLDDDLLAVARRRWPDMQWIHADLATGDLDGPYDVVVMAGNVLLFARPQDRAAIVANLAAHLAPGGRLVAGSSLESGPGGLTLEAYEQACADAGLEVEDRWSTWERDPLEVTPRYAVVVARRPESG
jgi:2-polyprenyl-3-methyl-5-hydroxy-6-metoxy-1,4-benzoquinol methylase